MRCYNDKCLYYKQEFVGNNCFHSLLLSISDCKCYMSEPEIDYQDLYEQEKENHEITTKMLNRYIDKSKTFEEALIKEKKST